MRAVVLNASIVGGVGGKVEGFLDVDDFGRLRLEPFLAGDGCFFDSLTGSFGTDVRIEVEIGFGPFAYTQRIPLANSTIADFTSFFCTPTDGIASPPLKGLATVGASPHAALDLVLNTGDRAGERVFVVEDRPGDAIIDPNVVGTDVAEGYDIRLAFAADGKLIDGALDIFGMGVNQRFGSPDAPIGQIVGNLGNGNDSLLIRSDVTNAANVTGGAGDDFMSGGRGNDTFDGGADNDILIGMDGNDLLNGGTGSDDFYGGVGADTMNGGAGSDKVTYENANLGIWSGVTFVEVGGKLTGIGGDAAGDVLDSIEYLVGTGFDDFLVSTKTGDPISTLEGRDGNDTLQGQDNKNDFLLGGRGGDLMIGGNGQDGTSYATSNAGVHIDMERRVYLGGDAQGDTLVSIEQVQGSAYADVIFGDAGENVIDGYFDDDRLAGGGGQDTIFGGSGDDTVFAIGDGDKLDGGGSLNDGGTDLLTYRVLTGTGVDVSLFNGDGGGGDVIEMARRDGSPDPVLGYSTFENLEGTEQADTLRGDFGDNEIRGLGGADRLRGDYGNDTLIGGTGADQLEGGIGLDLADYRSATGAVSANLQTGIGTGNDAQGDTFNSIEDLRGSDFSDALVGDAEDNVLDPSLGSTNVAETVIGGGGDDTLILDYFRGDVGKGLFGGYDIGSSNAGSFLRAALTSNDLIDSVIFSTIENLRVAGTSKADQIFGGAGDDVIATHGGDDDIYAGTGFDRIDAGIGNDTVSYGTNEFRALRSDAGAESFVLEGGRGIDTLNVSLGAVAEDVILSGLDSPVEVTGRNLVLENGAVISGFEVLGNVVTGAGDDMLIQLGYHNNDFRTGDGSDVIVSGFGFDDVNGGAETTGLFVPDTDGLADTTITDAAAFYESNGDVLVLDYSSLLTSAGVTSYTVFVDSGISFRDAGNSGITLLTNAGYYDEGGDNNVEFDGIERLYVTGTNANDVLLGTEVALRTADAGGFQSLKGDDILRGGAGNDSLEGYTGDDLLEGGAGNDILFGTNFNGLRDTAEVDTLSGGSGADQFVLGTASSVFYFDGEGPSPSHAVITDFSAAEGDTVHLNGTADNYRTEQTTDGSTLIYRIFPGFYDDLAARVQGVADFDLSADYVRYNTADFIPEPAAPAPLARGVTAEPAEALARATSGSFTVTETADVAAIQTALGAGTGVSGVRVTLEGAGEASGVFDGDPFGLGSGIVLSTGRAEDLVGANSNAPTTIADVLTNVKFESIGVSGNGSQIFRADLSGLGIDLRSITISDSGSKTGGAGGTASGFDLDAIALSTERLNSVDINSNLNLASLLPKLDVFDFDAASIHLDPGTQREPSDGFPSGPDLFGTVNGLVAQSFVRLDSFQAVGVTLGDGGSIGFDLNQTVSTDGPLYLYIGETGAFGETAAAELRLSSAPIGPVGDMSTDLGAPGVEGDQTKLTYAFTPDAGLNQIQFQFVVFSEALPELTSAALADLFNIRVNGVEFGSLSDGAALTLDNLLPQAYGPGHPDLILNPLGGNTRADGYTKVITLTAPVVAGVENILEVSVSDKGDGLIDSGILIKGGSIIASAGTDFPEVPFGTPVQDDAPVRNAIEFNLVSHAFGSLTTAANPNNLNVDEVPRLSIVAVSEDQGSVLFSHYASNLIPGFADNSVRATELYVFDVATGAVRLITHAAGSPNTGANQQSGSEFSLISADGTKVLFTSNATNLVAGFVDGGADIRNSDLYLHDTVTGITRLVSHAAGSQTVSANGDSGSTPSGFGPQMSDDGRYVMFHSHATNLTDGFVDRNGNNPDLYLYDSLTGTVTLVSASVDVANAGGQNSAFGIMSDDGTKVLVNSASNDLIAGFSNRISGLNGQNGYVYDIASGTMTLVTNSLDAGLGPVWGNVSKTEGAGGGIIDISEDGGTIAWSSQSRLFLTDVATSDIRFVGFVGLIDFQLSDDGDTLLVEGSARTYIPGYSGPTALAQTMVYDVPSGTFKLVEHAFTGSTTAASELSGANKMSADGRYVVFESGATNLVAGFVDGNPAQNDTYIFDTATSEIRLVSHALGSAVESGNGGTFGDRLQISADGQYVMFLSASTDLVANGPIYSPGISNTFLYETATGNITLLSQTAAGIAADGTVQYGFSFGPSGHEIIATTNVGDLAGFTGTDTNRVPDIYISTTTPTTVEPTTLSISATEARAMEGDAGTTELTFTVRRTGDSGSAAEAIYTVVGAVDASDFGGVLPTGTVRFAAGETQKLIVLRVSGDTASELNEGFRVVLSNPVGAAIGDAVAAGQILNDDGQALPGSVSIGDLTLTEGDAGTQIATFTLTRSGGDAAFDVAFATANGTALAGQDYDLASGVARFAFGVNTVQVSVTLRGDTAFEPDETFFVNLSNPTNGAVIGDGRAVGTIDNDDPLAAPSAPDLAAADDTGDPTDNLTAQSTDLTFTGSAVTGATVTVFAVTDESRDGRDNDGDSLVDEADETTVIYTALGIGVAANGAYSIDLDLGPGTTTLVAQSVLDGQTSAYSAGLDVTVAQAGTVSIGDVTLSEGDGGTRLATFTLTRTGGSAAFEVSYRTVEGTALSGSDFVAVGLGTVAFAAGETSKTISVIVNGDTAVEADEAFGVLLTGATNAAVIGDGTGTATIANDDASGTVSIGNATVVEGDAGTTLAIFTVTRSGGTAPFDVTYQTLGGTATPGSDFGAIPGGTLSFAAGETTKTISVVVNGDIVVETNETFSVILTGATNSAVLGDANGIGTITDDDSAVITNGAAGGCLYGTPGNDVIDARGGRDIILAGGGDDLIRAGSADDTVFGGAGNDTVFAGTGNDLVFGGAGNDVFVARPSDGNDSYFGDDGRDVIDFTAITAALSIELGVRAQSAQSGTDRLVSVENVIGGTGSDRIIGDGRANLLDGFAGNDTLNGQAGRDVLIGGAGNDVMTGGSDADSFVFRAGFGNDLIRDFDANPVGGQDLIDLTGFGITSDSFAERVTITDVGADLLVVVDMDLSQSIRLLGINNSNSVTVGDFLL